MSTNLQILSPLIAAKISAISGIHAVYEYEPDKPESGKYPFATVTPSEFNGEFADTMRNFRNYIFNVRIYQERTEAGFGNQKAERIIREICDDAISAFDDDTQLGGAVLWIRPVKANLNYDDRETGDTRVAEIVVEVHT
ncbi:hypothetical protein KBC89_03485, partial [Candidatus Woesebacteria bacterium]|nr:hypothetical protein [Candidatus Woesebacteria bacterium]